MHYIQNTHKAHIYNVYNVKNTKHCMFVCCMYNIYKLSTKWVKGTVNTSLILWFNTEDTLSAEMVWCESQDLTFNISFQLLLGNSLQENHIWCHLPFVDSGQSCITIRNKHYKVKKSLTGEWQSTMTSLVHTSFLPEIAYCKNNSSFLMHTRCAFKRQHNSHFRHRCILVHWETQPTEHYRSSHYYIQSIGLQREALASR